MQKEAKNVSEKKICTIHNILHRRNGQNILCVFAMDQPLTYLNKDSQIEIHSPDWMERWEGDNSLRNFLTFFVFSITSSSICATVYKMRPKEPTKVLYHTNYLIKDFPRHYHTDKEIEEAIRKFIQGCISHTPGGYFGVSNGFPEPHRTRIQNALTIAKELFGQHGDQNIFDAPKPR